MKLHETLQSWLQPTWMAAEDHLYVDHSPQSQAGILTFWVWYRRGENFGSHHLASGDN